MADGAQGLEGDEMSLKESSVTEAMAPECKADCRRWIGGTCDCGGEKLAVLRTAYRKLKEKLILVEKVAETARIWNDNSGCNRYECGNDASDEARKKAVKALDAYESWKRRKK